MDYRDLLKFGYRLFDIASKSSTPKGWNVIEYRADFVPAGTAYGVCLQEDDLVIDVDPRNFETDEFGTVVNSFSKLTHDAGLGDKWQRESLLVKTPSGGYHVYLKLPAGTAKPKKQDKRYPGIDFLSKGCYVVGVGSRFVNNAGGAGAPTPPYTPLTAPSVILPAPASLLSVLNYVDNAPKVLATGGYCEDDADDIEKFKAYLQALKTPEHGERSQAFFIAGCRGRDMGLSEPVVTEMVYAWQADECGCTIEDVGTRVANAFKYGKNTPGVASSARLRDKLFEGELVPSVSAVDTVVMPAKYDPLSPLMQMSQDKPNKTLQTLVYYGIAQGIPDIIRLNQLTNRYEVIGEAPWRPETYKDPALGKPDRSFLKLYIERSSGGLSFPDTLLNDAVTVWSSKHAYHPVREHLNGLVWDGKKRLRTWVRDYMGAPATEYTSQAGELLILAATKRIFYPGCKWDYLVIFEGAQGTGKSTACEILGHRWYSSQFLDPKHKDTISNMLESWVIEVAEMEVFKKAEVNALKAFLTRSEDIARLPFREDAKAYPRQSVFIGTINPGEEGYLNDKENRRYMPILTTKIDLDGLRKVRDQLFAEAVARVKAEGDSLYLYFKDEAVIAQHTAETVKRKVADPWLYALADYFGDNLDVDYISNRQVLENILGKRIGDITRTDQLRVTKVMGELGWTRRDVSGKVQYMRPLNQVAKRLQSTEETKETKETNDELTLDDI